MSNDSELFSVTQPLRVVDLQVALYAAQVMLDGYDEKEAVETAKSVHYDSAGSEMPAHALIHLLYSFATNFVEKKGRAH